MTEFKDLQPGDVFVVEYGYDGKYTERLVEQVTENFIIDNLGNMWSHDQSRVGDGSWVRTRALVYTDEIRDEMKYQIARKTVMRILDRIMRTTNLDANARMKAIPLTVLENIAAAGMVLLKEEVKTALDIGSDSQDNEL